MAYASEMSINHGKKLCISN